MKSPPTTEEKYEFWKHSFARQSFVDTQIFTEQIILHKYPYESPILKALTISALTCYARPFKHRPKTKLSEDVIPGQFRSLHNGLIILRDKVAAHRDLGNDEEWAKINRLDFHFKDGILDANTKSVIMPEAKAEEVNRYVTELIKVMDSKIDPFVHTHLEYLTQRPGIFALKLTEETDWLVEIS
ncbi:hypothetical protein P3T73_03405 [Kiritimatiellota bacterium B12222]|nr:hypothetical protein P3T73_03405 [Kiritimatiellota bacterium B12222]